MVNPSLCLFLHPITLLIFCNLISNIIRFLLLLVLQLLYFVIFSVLLTVPFSCKKYQIILFSKLFSKLFIYILFSFPGFLYLLLLRNVLHVKEIMFKLTSGLRQQLMSSNHICLITLCYLTLGFIRE